MKLLLIILLSLLLAAEEEYDDLSFDSESFEKKIFEYQGYLRSDNTFSRSKQEDIASSKNEFNFKADIDYNFVNLTMDGSFFYRDANREEAESESSLNALYQRFGDERLSLSLGKEVLRWGKGYAYSPVAFFERPKNPIYPDLSREGYWMAHANITQTLDKALITNYTLTLLLLPDAKENETLFEHTDSNYGAKLYLLIAQADIDLIVADDTYGVDFSVNAFEGLELHGEAAYKDANTSYLAGLRYQSSRDLTIIAEYTKTFKQEKFIYLKATQKEPFNIVYFSLYGVYIDDIDKNAYRLQAGGTYDFKNGLTTDLAFLSTDQTYGGKLILYYYF